MKILVIEDGTNYIDFPTGGVTTFCRSLLNEFKGELSLVGISTDDDTPIGRWSKKTINGTEYDYFSMMKRDKTSKRPLIPAGLSTIFQFNRYRKKILAKDYDIIFTHTMGILMSLPAHALRRTCIRLPGVENPLSISRYPWARCFTGIYDNMASKALQNTGKILATANEREIDDLLRRCKGRISRSQIDIFPTRYNETHYHVQNRAVAREKLGIPLDAAVFVTVGRLGWFKGWKLMIDAFDIVHRQKNMARLYFIGDGEDESKIKNYIGEKALTDSVILVGRCRPDVTATYLNAADTFVMGSFHEGWSTALVEACACGVPCVLTDFSSAKEMVADGVNGYVIDGRDEQEFADRMLRSLQIDRTDVIEYNKRYESLAVGNLKNALMEHFKTIK